MITDIALYIFSFILILFGAGLIVSSADKIAKKLKLSSFAVSFFVLGILTSTPEFAIGMTSVIENNPGIFVGNLIGGIAVIFLFIIPVVAIFGKGINVNHKLTKTSLIITLFVMLAPSISVLDKKVTNVEGLILIGLYCVSFYTIQRHKGILDGKKNNVLRTHSYSFMDIAKVLGGIAIVFISSHLIVDETIYFSNLFSISPYQKMIYHEKKDLFY